MEFDTRQSEAEKRSFRAGVAALVLLIAVVIAVQIAGVRSGPLPKEPYSSDRMRALTAGDLCAKLVLAWPKGQFTREAIDYYTKALPAPAAYRRLGVLKESYGKSGLVEFSKLDSAAKELGLTAGQITKLRREKAMWLRVFGSERLSRREAARYAAEVRTLNLGPLEDIAVYEVYRGSGETARAELVLQAARSQARAQIIGGGVLVSLLFCGGAIGVVIGVLFLVRYAPGFAGQRRASLNWSAGISAFVTYLASYIALGAVLGMIGEMSGRGASDVSYMALLIVAAAVAYTFGMLTLRTRARWTGTDWREIGYRSYAAGRDVVWGFAGYLAALAPVLCAAIIAYVLDTTVFRHFRTPEQPFQGIVSQGGALAIALTFFAASVVAPIVEETFFRGVLYTTLRGRMGVWAATAISSAMFAIIHPLPGGFLPIFVLACVFALMRERTGSLVPSMVCHGIYNTVQLLFALLLQ